MKASFYIIFLVVFIFWCLLQDKLISPRFEISLVVTLISFVVIFCLIPKNQLMKILPVLLFAFTGSIIYVLVWNGILMAGNWILLFFIWPLAIFLFDKCIKNSELEMKSIGIVILFLAIFITGIILIPNFPARYFVLIYYGLTLLLFHKLFFKSETLLYLLYWGQFSISFYLVASYVENKTTLPLSILVVPICSVCVLQACFYLREISRINKGI